MLCINLAIFFSFFTCSFNLGKMFAFWLSFIFWSRVTDAHVSDLYYIVMFFFRLKQTNQQTKLIQHAAATWVENDFTIFNMNATHSNMHTYTRARIKHIKTCIHIQLNCCCYTEILPHSWIRVWYDDEFYMLWYALDNVCWKSADNQIKTIFTLEKYCSQVKNEMEFIQMLKHLEFPFGDLS